MRRYGSHKTLVLLLAGLVISASFCAAQEQRERQWRPIIAMPLPYPYLSHPFYDYLEREETASAMRLVSDTKPYLSLAFRSPSEPQQVKSLFGREHNRFGIENTARSAVAGGMRGDYGGTWQRVVQSVFGHRPISRWFYDDGTHFLRFAFNSNSERRLAATFQPVYGLELINTDDARGKLMRFTSGARFEGGYAGKLRFLMDFRDHTETGNGPYWLRSRLYEDRWAAVDLKGNSSTSYDISESFIQYYGRDLSITVGRGRHHWGPGQFGSLFLNSNNPPFDYVRFDAVLEDEQSPRAIYYTFLHGFLQSATTAKTLYVNPDSRPRTLNAEKYLSAQRLEVRPRGNILLGFSQGVVYGDRGLQLGYLTPLNFLYSVQHSNDDKDNFVLGLDGTWRVVPGLKLYGEAFFDDIVVGDLTKATGNNKSAYTLGVHGIVPQPFWSKFDARVEYTKIRPFVYSHIFRTNTYSHWYSPLGYTREPNSEFMTAEFRGTFYPLQITLHWSRQNHGSVGGDIDSANFESNKTTFPFLSGTFERITRTGVRVTCEVLPNLMLFAEGMQIQQSHAPARIETRGGFGWNL